MYTIGQLNKYKSGSETEDRIASGQPKDIAAGTGYTLCVYSPDGSTFLGEMASWPPFLK